ncbi:TetR/AcrR family transcriptional regulator [Paenibacillus sinopodophylli]|uniref:TetR/AcrR family transcriptional regulator n=1 Tax=Paenibacillus sinopodophylli TaxID=1837342 RepID=UPI001487391E|nr:TetR family transcriptional regulator C-terminal domain-containing protein [Paenibacillus sinopodophylli]
MSQGIGTEEVKTTVQERILHAAEELFARNSFAGTRISEIALKAEVNQALIHYYFDSKEKLYQEVLVRLFQQWESYVQAFTWVEEDPALMIREYIKTHFEIKCRMPNLYKMFHWEALEGGELFNKYASSTWVQDFLEKADLFKRWKQAGVIHSNVNETIVLFSMWGMMNQFYYRSFDNLKAIVGSDGNLEALQAEVAEQMIELTLNGILAKDDSSFLKEPGVRKVATVFLEQGDEHEEQLKLIDALTELQGLEVKRVYDEEEALAMDEDAELLVVCASTQYGEMSEPLYRLLDKLEKSPSKIADRFIAIWTVRSSPAAETLQRTLEDAFNRVGAFSIARVSGQSPRDYIKRCAKLTRM